jgi:hypothetical protein
MLFSIAYAYCLFALQISKQKSQIINCPEAAIISRGNPRRSAKPPWDEAAFNEAASR